MIFVKQSTAVEVKVGPFLDDTDGKTAETALTITSAEVLLAKGAGDWAAKNEATSLVHESNGWYRCLLDATDTNTLGTMVLQIAEAGALPVWLEMTVLAANVYDSLIGGGDTLDVQVTGMGADTVTASAIAANAIGSAELATGAITSATFAAGAIDAAAIATNAIGASELAADAATEIANAVWDTAMVEPTGVPAVTAAMRSALAWLFARDRNKVTQTSTTTTFFNDAGTSIATAAVDDTSGTFTRQEWV